MEDLPLLSLDGEMGRPATVIVQMLLIVVMMLVIVIMITIIMITIKIKFSKLQQCREILIDILRKQSKNLSSICVFPGDV